MNKQSTKLLLVGKGQWSKKISDALNHNLEDVGIDVIQSRALNLGNFKKKVSQSTHVWFCCRPDNQAFLLNEISEYLGTIILEKPLGETIDDFRKIRTYLASNRRISLSRVWSYSEIWQEWLQIAKGIVPNKIEIQRGDSRVREWLNPIIDWYAHDIYLLSEWLGIDLCNIEDFERLGDDLQLTAKFRIRELGTKVEFTCGRFEAGRVARWDIYINKDTLYTLNFTEGLILLNNRKIFIANGKYDAITRFFLDTKRVNSQKEKLLFEAQMSFAKYIYKKS